MFTDHPLRRAQLVRSARLASSWPQLFATDPPNGVLTGVTADGHAVNLAVEVLDLSGDETRLAATVRGIGSDAGATAPGPMTDASLFVDDVVVPTPATQWNYHSFIPDRTDEGRYIPKYRIDEGDLDPVGDFIYSFPASALIEDYRPRGIDLGTGASGGRG
jgi:hypothetical protein